MADRSDFGWSNVEHYESYPLVADSDDVKQLEKAKKEAERAANKRWCGSGSTGIKKRSGPGGAGPSSRSREPQVSPHHLPCCPRYHQGHCTGAVFLLWTVWPPGKDVSKENSVSFEPACGKQGWHN